MLKKLGDLMNDSHYSCSVLYECRYPFCLIIVNKIHRYFCFMEQYLIFLFKEMSILILIYSTSLAVLSWKSS
jgi:hypothetical protein